MQLATVEGSSGTGDGNQIIGMMAILIACTTSGFAGVYLEKILKGGKKTSLMMRNVQLGFYGVLIGLITVFASDGAVVREKGFFVGYGYKTAMAIVTHAVGGLLVAMVMKYADNILKGFATSLAIVLATVMSSMFFGTPIQPLFAFGTAFVLAAVYLYGKYPYSAAPTQSYSPVPQQEK